MHHLERLAVAKKAADNLMSDTSVDQTTTRESLKELAEHIEELLDTLRVLDENELDD